ncbi:MAG: TatD family hydrolase [Oscillospiraceae bacterium]|nr:TatD family hydrolase [Oscillospiraceae bacterium]
MMELFDSHAHYNDEQYDLDRDEIIKKIFESGVTKIINAGYNVEASKTSIELAEKYDFIYAAVGIHPQDIENISIDLIEIEKLSNHSKVIAIGEIGLDYHWNKENKQEQIEAFARQIELANKLDLPIVIHSRDAYVDTINVLKNMVDANKKGVFHCCPLNAELVKDALDLGYNISFAGAITFKNVKNADEIIKMVPMDRIQIETDAPYLSPEPFRGKRNDSTRIKYIAQKVATARGISVEEVAKMTYENTLRMFGRIS